MGLEFHDPYSCIECENGLLMVFSEYLTYQFLCLGQHSSLSPRKYISVAVSLAKLLCGPVLTRLKSSDASLSRQLADMLTSYCELQRSSQAYHVEAVERLIIGDDVQNKMVSVLQRVVTGLPSGPRAHAFLAVDSTLVRACTRAARWPNCHRASFLHLLLLVNALKPSDAPTDDAEGGPSDDAEAGPRQPTAAIREVLCFLTASRSPLSPYLVYVMHVWDGMDLVIVCDLCMTDVAGGLCEAIESVARCHQAVTPAQRSQIYGHLKHGLTVLFSYTNQLGRSAEVRSLVGRLRAQWGQLRRLKVDAVLCGADTVPPAVDQGLATLSRTLESTFEAVCHALPERAAVSSSQLLRLLDQAQAELDHYRSFLFARAVSNATVETRSHLSISRYLDNFPDLVHFIYVDRSAHLMTAPSTRPPDGRHDLTDTVWSMIDLANRYLCEGHMSMIWRDQHYSYGHFLWFEDAMGNPQKAKESPKRLKALYPDLQPGILVRDYFSTLISVCFPDATEEGVRCYQLFLVHKGPVQSSRVLEQSQRIAKTVWEVSGAAATPLDLL
ncbi:Hermansky-Pudlak syndrome 1 protein homolog [Pollicipes pollicipes]|uniref:Hermansky-Pudlak syndrome 1 protein homolog n=1 Tax=Pollicipes pollicipes TaxID=41117 RepID=UPI0018856E9C|nr:Hermansky-Pudlak syndrome 1 protein homolog [Pollicipes pollicipes]